MKRIIFISILCLLALVGISSAYTLNATHSNHVARSGVNEAWGTIRNGAGVSVGDPGDTLFARTTATSTSGQYSHIQDIGLTFNLSSNHEERRHYSFSS